MKSLLIAMKDIKIQMKDRKQLVLMLLMPIVLTAILGTALKGVLDSGEAPKTVLGLYNTDKHNVTNGFIDSVLKSKDMKTSLELKIVTSEKQLKNYLKVEKIDAGLVIPEGWGNSLVAGKPAHALIYQGTGKGVNAAFIQQLTDTYTNAVQTVSGSTTFAVTNLAIRAKQSGVSFNPEESEQQISTAAEKSIGNKDYLKDAPVGNKSVSAMQYYAAAMAAMFLLFNAINGGKSFHNERGTETLARLMVTPTTSRAILGGKFLGTWFIALLQFLVFMIVTHYVLVVDWGSNVWQTLVLALIYSFAVAGLSMVVAAFTKSERAADAIGGVGVQIFAILGGSMIPITSFPEVLRSLSKVTPNSWALTGFVDIMGGTTTWNSLILPVFVLAGIGLCAAAIGVWRLRVEY